MLERRGFEPGGEGETASCVVKLEIRMWRVREDRYVKKDETVMRASLVAEVRRGAGGEVLYQRRVLSRPEYGRDAVETGIRSARDAFQVLAGPLAEALRRRIEEGKKGKGEK